jgi:hypothetical protein
MRVPDSSPVRYDPRRYGSIDDVRSERIRWAHDYWSGKRGGDTLPSRTEIDPVEMPRLLPYLMLIEVIDGRIRYRLAGTQVVANAGFDFTGRFLDELKFPNRDFYLTCYGEIRDNGAPIFGLDHWTYPDGRSGVSEFAMLPLSGDGKTVTHFLTIEDTAER